MEDAYKTQTTGASVAVVVGVELPDCLGSFFTSTVIVEGCCRMSGAERVLMYGSKRMRRREYVTVQVSV